MVVVLCRVIPTTRNLHPSAGPGGRSILWDNLPPRRRSDRRTPGWCKRCRLQIQRRRMQVSPHIPTGITVLRIAYTGICSRSLLDLPWNPAGHPLLARSQALKKTTKSRLRNRGQILFMFKLSLFSFGITAQLGPAKSRHHHNEAELSCVLHWPPSGTASSTIMRRSFSSPGGDQHAVGLQAHHLPGGQVHDGHQVLPTRSSGS